MSENTTLESRIVRVEIHRRKALITRAVQLTLDPGGAVPLRLAGLPVTLEDDSVRLSLPSGGGRLLDLRVELELAPASGDLRGPEAEVLRDLLRQRVDLDVQAERVGRELGRLHALQPGRFVVTDLPEQLAFSARPTARAWLKLLPDLTGRLGAARDGLRGLRQAQERLEDQIQAARDQYRKAGEQAMGKEARAHKAVWLRLESTAPAEQALALELSYLIPAARWLPEYELRVDREEDQAELVLRASLAQRSGESWHDVALACSSADLARSAALPRLDSWRIGRKQAPPATGWRELPGSTHELFVDYDRGAAAAPTPRPGPQLPGLPEQPRLGQDPDDMLTQLLRAPALASNRQEPVGSCGGMAPPPPRQPSRPPMAAPEQALSLSGGLLDSPAHDEAEDDFMEKEETFAMAKEDRVMEPSPAMAQYSHASASAPEGLKKKAKSGRRRSAPAPQCAPAPLMESPAEEAPALPDAGDGALAFHRLKLAGPEDYSQRGKLKALSFKDEVASQDAELARLPAGELRRCLAGPQAGRVTLPVPEHGVPLEQSAGHFTVRYPAEGVASVASDGAPHRVGLLRRTGPVRRVYRCVPARDRNVYEQCTFENPVGLPLLAGPIRVYRGGDYVVSGPLATTPRGGEVTVGLGVEPGIVVARNCSFEERTQGLFGGDTVLDHTITLEVRSRLGRPARLELLERVPVSGEKDVEVALVSTEPEATPYDQRDRGQLVEGGLCFGLDLSPGENRTCTLKYRVTIPSKMALQGGNRRD